MTANLLGGFENQITYFEQENLLNKLCLVSMCLLNEISDSNSKYVYLT